MKRAVVLMFLIVAFAAYAGEGDSEYGLGRATWRAGNAERALEYFEQAVKKGHVEATFFLGVIYAKGEGVTQDEAKAVQYFRIAAEKGHLDAMNHLAWHLRNGRGVEKNFAEALQWYRKNSAAGNVIGMINLADIYYDGNGVAQDYAQAAEWYRKAGEKGDARSMLQYGYMLSHGQGVALDTTAAMTWYRNAARAGNSSAMFNIAEYYNVGKGVEKNPAAARFWYLRAAMNGDTDAEAKFASMAEADSPAGQARFDESERMRMAARTNAEFAAAKAKSFPILLEGAELGHLPAIAAMVNAYQYGDGTEKDMVKAREWAMISAEMGNDSSQTILAQYMLEGIGGPRNTQGARFWFEKAALSGNSLAMWKLAKIYDGDYGLPPNEALATYWWKEAYKAGSPTAEKTLKDRGLLQPDPVAQAFIDRIHRDGPNRTSVMTFTFDVAQYCKYDGPRCHELSVAARKFERDQNSAVESANMARLWNVYSNDDPNADAKWRERSNCMQKKTESIQKHTYGQQDWYYTGSCY